MMLQPKMHFAEVLHISDIIGFTIVRAKFVWLPPVMQVEH